MDQRNYFTLHIKHDYNERKKQMINTSNERLDNLINERKTIDGMSDNPN